MLDAAIESSERVRGWLEPKHDADGGPVTSWSSGSVQVWSDRPWSQDGSLRDLLFHASIGLTAEFSDFTVLGGFLDHVGGTAGGTVERIEWTLTEAGRAAALESVRSRAVEDAVAKAHLYARSLGLADVRAIAVADEGMLGDTGSPPMPLAESRMMSMPASGGPELSLRPDDIVVEAAVDARFTAS